MSDSAETKAAGGIRVVLDSLGCKLNQAETELLAREFVQAGFELVSASDKADICILNTCTVTHIADRKSRHWLRLAHRRNPNALLVATGCYAQWASQELARIQGVSLVLSNEEKPRLLELVKQACKLDTPACGQGESISPLSAASRTRAFVKVQDGCNDFCAYCIVPLVRGRERSLPLEGVIAGVRERAAEGYNEVVLTGVKIGSYSREGINFKGLLERMLAGTAISRLRISSLDPREIEPELIGLWWDNRLCRHFHLSLQSGSDAVLSRMNRRYSTGEYRQSVSLVRSLVPGAAITTDIIVGFPGESEAEFEASLDFCRQMAFARIHVFPFSPRWGTEAARMPRPVAQAVKKQRADIMLDLAKESAQKFDLKFLGETMPVLWEKKTDGVWSGLTDNYIRVYTRSSRDLTNIILPVRLVKLYGDGVWGDIEA